MKSAVTRVWRNPTKQNLVAVLALQLAIAFGVYWIMQSYFEVDVARLLIAAGDDGWCKVPQESIGVHCFGDFNERVNQHVTDHRFPAWSNNMELMPIGPYLTVFGDFLTSLLGARKTLVVIGIVYLLFLTFPILHATRNHSFSQKILFTSLFALGTYPVVVSLDRLNGVCLTVPLLYWFYRAVRGSDDVGILWSIVLLSLIKPQFALLLLVFLFMGKWLRALTTALASGFFIVLFVVAVDQFNVGRFFSWTSTVLSYSPYSLDSANPPNISWSNLFYQGTRIIGFFLGNGIHATNNSFQRFAVIVVLILVVIAIFVAMANRKRTSRFEFSLVLTAVTVMGIGGVANAYYLVFSIPILALVAEFDFRGLPEKRQRFDGQSFYPDRLQALRNWCLAVALVTSQSLILFPLASYNQLISEGSALTARSGMQLIASLAWLSYATTVVISGFFRRTSESIPLTLRHKS